MSMNIEYVGRDAIVDTPDVAFTYQGVRHHVTSYKLKTTAMILDWNNPHSLVITWYILLC
jgi:hypothetical protein